MESYCDLVPLTPKQLTELQQNLVLVDIRPTSQYCSKHIRHAENINFSNILMRRLLKKVVTLESMITSPEAVERICRRSGATKLVLYDEASTAAGVKPELMKHAQVLCNSESGDSQNTTDSQKPVVYFVDGKLYLGSSFVG